MSLLVPRGHDPFQKMADKPLNTPSGFSSRSQGTRPPRMSGVAGGSTSLPLRGWDGTLAVLSIQAFTGLDTQGHILLLQDPSGKASQHDCPRNADRSRG